MDQLYLMHQPCVPVVPWDLAFVGEGRHSYVDDIWA